MDKGMSPHLPRAGPSKCEDRCVFTFQDRGKHLLQLCFVSLAYCLEYCLWPSLSLVRRIPANNVWKHGQEEHSPWTWPMSLWWNPRGRNLTSSMTTVFRKILGDLANGWYIAIPSCALLAALGNGKLHQKPGGDTLARGERGQLDISQLPRRKT